MKESAKLKRSVSLVLIIATFLFGVYFAKSNADSLPLCPVFTGAEATTATISNAQNSNFAPIVYSGNRFILSNETISKTPNKHIQPKVVFGMKEYAVTLIFVMALFALLKRFAKVDFLLPFKSFLIIIHYIHNMDGSKSVLA